jgi:hypothetical protein
MPTYPPAHVLATIGNADEQYGVIVAPGFAWVTRADQVNDTDSVIEEGRFFEPLGEVWSNGNVKRQDTYLSGSAGRTGKAFTASGGGSFKDDHEEKQYNTYCILQQDGNATSGSEGVLTAVDTTEQIEHCEILLERGYPPIHSSINTYTKANTYAYIELAADSPDKLNYRLAIEYGQSVALDRTEDGGTTWQRVKQCRELGNVERYLRSHDNLLRIRIQPDYDEGIMIVEIGDGHYLTDSRPLKSTEPLSAALPSTGKVVVRLKNAWSSFAYYPLRYDDPTVKRSERAIDLRLDTSRAIIAANGSRQSNEGQSLSGQLTASRRGKLGWEATAARADAGDGEGSKLPSKFSDITIIVPAEYSFDLSSTLFNVPALQRLDTQFVDELEVWDDVTRTRYHSAMLACDNTLNQYSGAYGRVALDLKVNVGSGFWQRMRGYAGDGEKGIEFLRQNPISSMFLPASDKSIAMMTPLLDECDFDGWHWTSFVHFLCSEKGGIHRRFMRHVPVYVPPGGTYERPYGPAGKDAQGYILGKGLGSQALHHYEPSDIPWYMLQELALRMSETDPYTGLQAPYMMGLDPWGEMHFEPIFYSQRFPVATYSEEDRWGDTLPILAEDGGLQVFNSVQQMRTDLHFQTIDNRTGELLYVYLPMPNWVKRAVGFNFGWLERDAKFGNEEGLLYAALSGAYQATRPTQSVRFMSFYRPEIFAGQTIRVVARNPLGGAANFVILSIRSRYGMAGLTGAGVSGYSVIEARRVENLL